MELELGLKFTRICDEFTSDFQLAKDRSGPLFLSRETDSTFILTAHLKGYRRGNIKIDINEDGSLIAISGEKQVKETVMVDWKVYKKDTEIKGFKKVYKIPDGVNLDKIKAKFNEDESTLTITMPKKVKGIRGTKIEEIEQNQELVKQGSANLQIVDEKDEKSESKNGENGRNFNEIEEIKTSPSLKSLETEEVENEKAVDDIEERSSTKPGRELNCLEENNNQDHDEVQQEKNLEKNVDEIEEIKTCPGLEVPEVENQKPVDEIQGPDIDEEKEEIKAESGKVEEREHRRKRCKMCIPIVAGSTLLLSLVVFVIQIVRSKNQSGRRRD